MTLVARQNTNTVQLPDTNNMVVKQWNGSTGNNGYFSCLTKGGDLWQTVEAAWSVAAWPSGIYWVRGWAGGCSATWEGVIGRDSY
ncbi:MAG TPA: hypothetical protein VK168_12685 [Saprospiraceae bacterium]|nr:hypothetical protein [Saprospiraceae bacterium]